MLVKIKGSTIIETIVAALILLISFAAGLAIYVQVIRSVESNLKMRAVLDQDFLTDSLSAQDQLNQVVYRKDMNFKVEYETDERWPALVRLHLIGYDLRGIQLTEKYKLLSIHENKEN